jgi:hypothetical protein
MTATRSRTSAASASTDTSAAVAAAVPETASDVAGAEAPAGAGKGKAKGKKVNGAGKGNAAGKANANANGKANPARAKAKMQARKAKVAAEQGGEAATGAAPAGKAGKQQLVRDSFTIPKNEYHALDQLKKRAMGLEHDVRKGELLRAGIQALAAMPDKAFLAALKAVPTLKTGRPRLDKSADDAAEASED